MTDDYLEGALADLGARLSGVAEAIEGLARRLDHAQDNADREAAQLLRIEQKFARLELKQDLASIRRLL